MLYIGRTGRFETRDGRCGGAEESHARNSERNGAAVQVWRPKRAGNDVRPMTRVKVGEDEVKIQFVSAVGSRRCVRSNSREAREPEASVDTAETEQRDARNRADDCCRGGTKRNKEQRRRNRRLT